MTPSRHKEEPVWNFLCEDSCVCGHAGETVEVRQCDSVGVPLLLLCSTLFFSLIHSVVSCLLYFASSASFPAAQPPLPLSGLFILSTTPQTRVQLLGLNTQRKATMPQLALAARVDFPPFPPCVSGHMLSLVSWRAGEDIYDISLSFHNICRMPELTALAFPILECTLIILPTSLYNSNDLKNGWC